MIYNAVGGGEPDGAGVGQNANNDTIYFHGLHNNVKFMIIVNESDSQRVRDSLNSNGQLINN